MQQDNSHICPHCESSGVSRSRVRGLDHLWRVLQMGKRPYRCLDCWTRFWEAPQRRATQPTPEVDYRPSHGRPSILPGM